MDKGSVTRTEYKYNEKKRDSSGYLDRHIDYTNEHEEALEWKIGQIHSHNTMRVFFSDVDTEELVENSDSHNYYLSLIVNNYMDMIAKVAYKATAEATVEIPYKAIDDVGESYTVSTSNFKVSKSVLITHECDIQAPQEKLTVEEEFMQNVEDVIKIANTPAPKPPVVPSSKNPAPATTHSKVSSKTLLDVEKTDNPFDDETLHTSYLDPVELFTMSLFLGGEIGDSYEDLEDVLEEIEEMAENTVTGEDHLSKLSDVILSNYPNIFHNMYKEQAEEEGVFELVTIQTIDLLEAYESRFKFLSKTIMALKYMLNKFEHYGNATV